MRNWTSCLILVWLWPALAFGQPAQVDGGGPPDAESSASDAAAAAAERAARLAGIGAEKASGKAELGAAASSKDATTGDPGHPPPGVVFDKQTLAEYQRAWQAYYAYRVNGYAQRQRVFEWQDISTKVTFAVVIFLVLAGVYFAAVQFHVGMRAGRETGEPGEVELTVKGIKVRSPVLGVIVLTLSLAFFYLYLIYVYPIENVF